MSFSFRNIFTPDEDDIGGVPGGSETPGGVAGGGASRGGADAKPAAEPPGQDFLISELIAFIPPAISAQSGIPMTRELRIPLPADGSRDVKLSTIYQLCPELFAAEITPLNDSVVTLPPKIGAMGETGATSGVSGFSPAAGKPFAGFSGEPPASDNPFWSPTSPAAERKSGSDTLSPPKSSPGAMNPFSAQDFPVKPSGEGNSPAGAAPSASPEMSAGFEGPIAKPESGDKAFPGGKSSGFGSLSSSALFGGKGAAFRNEADDKGSHSFGGKKEDPFSTLFSMQAKADEDIPEPKSEAAEPSGGQSGADHTEGGAGEEHQGVWGAMFQGGGSPASDNATPEHEPFSPPAFESIGNLLKQGSGSGADTPSAGFSPAAPPTASPSPAPMEPAPPAATGFSAFEADPEPYPPASKAPEGNFPAMPREDSAAKSESSEAKPPAQTFAGFGIDPTPPLSPIPAFSGTPAFEPLDFADPSPAPAPAPEPEPVSAPEPEPAPEPVFASEPEPVAQPQPEETPARAFRPEEAHPAPALSGADGEPRDLELRAIFSTSETFTLSMVARRIVGLPGIVNCTLSTPGKLVQASKTDSGRIGGEAREMVATLRNLAKLTGLPEARTFTLHTDRGIVSLFLEGECCVMVTHETASFEPGVREKLILAARSLIKLEE